MKKNKIFAAALLSGCILAAAPVAAQDQTVALKTAKAAGSQMTLLMNRVSGLSVDWGDGNFVPVEKGTGDVIEVTGTVLGEDIVVKGGSSFKMLGCAGNELTQVDATGAKGLKSLYCQNNQLTSLKITGLTELTDLNCSNNQLTALSMSSTSYPALETVNVSNNSLGGAWVFSQGNLQYLDMSNNRYTSLSLSAATNLKALAVSNNQLRIMNLANCGDLSVLLASGNMITSITGDGFPELTQMVCDDNRLTTLPLSESAGLDVLSCQNNGSLSALNLNGKAFPSVLYCGGNSLTFASFPSVKPAQFSGMPQAQIKLATMEPEGYAYSYIKMCPSWTDRRSTDYILDVSDFRKDASGSTRVQIDLYVWDGNGTGTLLEAGSSSAKPNDYYNGTGKIVVFKPYWDVYVQFTHPSYPDVVLNSNYFAVIDFTDPDGISGVSAESGLEVSVANGMLVLASGTPVGVNVYTADGKRVWTGSVSGNATTLSLPRGLYIVNGKKVVL